MIIIADF